MWSLEKRNEYYRQYRKRNPEKHKEHQKRSYEKNKEKRRAAQRERYYANPEKEKARRKAYCEINQEKLRARHYAGREKTRSVMLQRKYGITLEQRNANTRPARQSLFDMLGPVGRRLKENACRSLPRYRENSRYSIPQLQCS